jgi:hypothetical protein
MRLSAPALLLLITPALGIFLESAHAQQPEQKPSAPPVSASKPKPSQPPDERIVQPSPQMQKLLAAFSGKWIYHFKYESSETRPNGGTSEGEAVFRPGPGGLSMIEDEAVREPRGETSGMSVT